MEANAGRIKELDYVRVVCMLAVILLHTTSGYIFENRFAICGINPAFFLNQIVRFAVPLFIVLSGISLSLSKKKVPASVFLKNRFLKIILPYLAWSAVYYLYNVHFSLSLFRIQGLHALKAFLNGLLVGGFAPHLYFVIVISQLYLLYPLLKKIRERFPALTLVLSFAVTLFFQECIYLSCRGIEVLPPLIRPYVWFSFPTWLFYFVAGMYSTQERLNKLFTYAKKYFLWLLIAAGAFVVFFVFNSKATNSYELSIKPIILPFVAIAFTVICGFAGFFRNLRGMDRFIAVLSKISYQVYLCHVLFLFLLRKCAFFSQGMFRMIALFFCVSGASILFSWLLEKGLFLLRRALHAYAKKRESQFAGRT